LIYLVSLVVFAGVIFFLVGTLLLVEAGVVQKGDRRIVINDDEETALSVPSGSSLLAALSQKDVLLPSACGGRGTCSMCKCRVLEGGRDVLPTELVHLSRSEKLDHVRLACQVKVKEDLRIRIPEEVFNIKKYNATVVSNENVASFIKELRLAIEPGETLDFKSGAYVQIDVPEYAMTYEQIDVQEQYRKFWTQFDFWGLKSGADEPIFRAYSMANYPGEDELRFTIRIATPPPGAKGIPPGVASSYLFARKPGDRLVFSGPYGDFFIKDTDREMCFIGGGAGMAPMRSHIFDQLLNAGTERRMTFWYGARSRIEMFYDEEFKALEAEHPNFSYTVALSDPQPEDNWDGPIGFIHQVAHDHYLAAHKDPTEIEYYLCGPPMMLDAVTGMLDSLGVEADMIAYDDFG
jgi:Na+-transporting NADH:ubiquinone oxidoreductase subunit F